MEVKYADVKENLSGDYSNVESKFYAVGVNYSVNEDSIFFSNGISYIEMMEARQEGILINGDGEMFDTIGQTVKIENTKSSNSLIKANSEHAINSKIGIPSSTTSVYLGYYDSNDKTRFLYYVDKNCNKDFKPATISFGNYCLAVTAG